MVSHNPFNNNKYDSIDVFIKIIDNNIEFLV